MSASTTRLKEPCILLAGSNCRKLVRNIEHILERSAIESLNKEIDKNVAGLFSLGDSHISFAQKIHPHDWRQKISRLYYGAYNIRRAIVLHFEGHFATDSSDHKNIGKLPLDFPRANTFESHLETLRDDRNLADYNHLAHSSDLMMAPDGIEAVVLDFRTVAFNYLNTRGLTL